MEKKLEILLILLLLTGCQKTKQIACSYVLEDKQITLDIVAINDEISSIHERTVFEIPNYVIMDETKLSFLEKQLDSSYHFEGNELIKEVDLKLDRIYSLNKTMDVLKTKRFICE